ncbi:chemotaxis protein CheA [Aestuariivirga litoralis]|uniref:Chemotaxis protein CheA n=1 Tax=Aestuariivirga litoralis TaxID=2650924 RepID=A0A2W2B8D5_9HYPH|nr:chemotaxis protein CheA [Aestuariivirga litoralis]PZF76564.1 chemotaxis protein CheA [Aestuariivirga litoralis]
MDPMAEIRLTFFQECEEQLAALENGLLAMQEGETDSETVNAVFRAVHSIKGGAGAFKLDALVSFAHVFETALDKVRSGSLAPDADAMKLFLRAADALADLVAASRDGAVEDASPYVAIEEEFNALIGGGPAEEEDEFAGMDFQPIVTAFDEPAPARNRYAIRFRPLRELYAKANEPLALLRELARLGTLESQCDIKNLPFLDTFEPEDSYLSWELQLDTDASLAAVKEVFDFVEGDCDLAIAAQPPAEQAAPVPQEMDITAILRKVREEAPAIAAAAAAAAPAQPEAEAAPKARAVVQPTIRVDLDRVDRLINLVGELVINQAMLTQRVLHSSHVRDREVTSSLEELERLTREIQESVMAIRAQPVRPLFQRMSRIVREVADATAKDVRLRTEGEATEVDKTVVELLADPLTHMIRNAVDHGLESPEQRTAAGKPPEGTVRLAAAHRSGRVIIEVSDDGQGINRPRVLQKAIANGLVPPDAQLSDSEIDNLLFLPGFSTASSVSNISGRGVGMDVVKRSIQALGGRISISSAPGQGSTFTLSLPLTLAVLDGIVVTVDEQVFVIPLTAIVETVKHEPSRIHHLGDHSFVLRVRDVLVPLVDVGAELGVRAPASDLRSGVAILIETANGTRSALLVDNIQDQRQVVIKSLETNYMRVDGIAAATILGDGRVAMILDVDALVGPRHHDWAQAEIPLAKAS